MQIAQFNRFEVELTDQAVAACHHQGSCDADVEFWAPRMAKKRDMERCSPEALRAELDEYGCWDEDELSNDDDNWKRIVWMAAVYIQDRDEIR